MVEIFEGDRTVLSHTSCLILALYSAVGHKRSKQAGGQAGRQASKQASQQASMHVSKRVVAAVKGDWRKFVGGRPGNGPTFDFTPFDPLSSCRAKQASARQVSKQAQGKQAGKQAGERAW